MSDDLDLDRLGDLWRQPPSPQELAELQRTAKAVERRARWGQRIDLAAAALVGGVVLFLVLSNPELDTLIVGAAAILVLLSSQYRNRRLRREELRGLTGSGEQLLDQSITRLQQSIKRTRFHLIALPPSFALGLGFGAVVGRNFAEPSTSLTISSIALLIVALGAFYFTRSMRASRQQLDRLMAMREAYRREGETNSPE